MNAVFCCEARAAPVTVPPAVIMGRCESVFFNSGLNGALDGAASLPLGHATGGRPSSALPAADGRFYAAWRVRSRKLESVAKVA